MLLLLKGWALGLMRSGGKVAVVVAVMAVVTGGLKKVGPVRRWGSGWAITTLVPP